VIDLIVPYSGQSNITQKGLCATEVAAVSRGGRPGLARPSSRVVHAAGRAAVSQQTVGVIKGYPAGNGFRDGSSMSHLLDRGPGTAGQCPAADGCQVLDGAASSPHG
jgi:hypothetical protein